MTRGNQGHLLIMFGSDGAERYLVKRLQVIVRPVVVCPLQKAEQGEGRPNGALDHDGSLEDAEKVFASCQIACVQGVIVKRGDFMMSSHTYSSNVIQLGSTATGMLPSHGYYQTAA
jgi:hypothetical protein